MPIKNYSAEVPANRSIAAIQDALVKHGATGISMKYEQGTGQVDAIIFQLPINNTVMDFSLPVQWRRFKKVLENQRVRGKVVWLKFSAISMLLKLHRLVVYYTDGCDLCLQPENHL